MESKKRISFKLRHIISILLSIVIISVGYGCGGDGDKSQTPVTYSTSDLEGEWYIQEFFSPPTSDRGAWQYGTVTFNNGDATINIDRTTSGADNGTTEQVNFTINNSGIIFIYGEENNTPQPGDSHFLRAVMFEDKSTIVGVETYDVGTYGLIVMQKNDSTSFSSSDLEGTWNFSSIISPPSADSGASEYAAITLDNNGEGTAGGDPISFSINSEGTVYIGGMSESDGRLVMSGDKYTLVGVAPHDHPPAQSYYSYTMLVAQKRGPTTFATSDLEGTWNLNSLISPPSDGAGGWTYGTITLDNNGIGTVNEIESKGGTVNNPISFSINSEGTVYIGGMSESDGRLVMSEDKNSIIGVAPHDGDSDVLIILNRENRTDGGGTDPCTGVGCGTIRLVWGDSDSLDPSDAPSEGDCADWRVFKGSFAGPQVLRGSSCGYSVWDGIDDVAVPVDAGTPYSVGVEWFSDSDGVTDFTDIYVTASNQIITLHY